MALINKSILKKRIQQVYEKSVQKGLAFKSVQQTVSLSTLNLHANYLARLITKTIEQERFRPSYLHPKKIQTRNKERVVFPLTPIDNIVQGVLFEILLQHALPKISQHVHSYIPGRGTQTAIYEFVSYIKKFNLTHPKDDIYILRTDINKFTDSIPLNKNSKVWKQLDSLIASMEFDEHAKPYLTQLIHAYIQPFIQTKYKSTYQSIVGLPMGTPLSSIVANLYLADLDRAIESLSDILYLRYGDDLLIAHHDPNIIVQAEKIYEEYLVRLELSRNRSKDLKLYFTRSGRSHFDPDWKGTDTIDYIGFSVNRLGNKSISVSRRRRLLISLKKRIRRTQLLVQHYPRSKQITILCETITKSIDPMNPQVLPEAFAFLKYTNDRPILQQFDYSLAYQISHAITKIVGPKTFREVSMRKIREYLPALVLLKNKKM